MTPAEIPEGVKSDELMPLIRVDAEPWYARDDFMAWLNDENQTGPATWHQKGGPASDYSDVFVTFCQGDGSDAPVSVMSPAIPEDIWEQLCAIAEKHGHDECLFWIRNLPA